MNNEENQKRKYNLNFSRKRDLEKLKECLVNIMSFVFCDSQYQQMEIELDFSFKKPNFKRQKILTEQGILDLISQVVESAFPKQSILQKVIFTFVYSFAHFF
jgi:hypothetical protein